MRYRVIPKRCYFAITSIYLMINRSIFFADRLSRTHTHNKSVDQQSDGAMTRRKIVYYNFIGYCSTHVCMMIIIIYYIAVRATESSIQFAVSSKVLYTHSPIAVYYMRIIYWTYYIIVLSSSDLYIIIINTGHGQLLCESPDVDEDDDDDLAIIL